MTMIVPWSGFAFNPDELQSVSWSKDGVDKYTLRMRFKGDNLLTFTMKDAQEAKDKVNKIAHLCNTAVIKEDPL